MSPWLFELQLRPRYHAPLGEVGDGTTIDRDRPVPVQGVRNAVALATGGDGFSAALLADGTVMTWGNSANGSLGRPPWVSDSSPSPTPALVPGVQGIRAIGAGLRHMIALTEAGTVISWGDDTYGNLGRENNKTNVPGVIKSLTGVQSIFTQFSLLCGPREWPYYELGWRSASLDSARRWI